MPKKAHKPLVEDIDTEEEWLDLLKTEVQTWTFVIEADKILSRYPYFT